MSLNTNISSHIAGNLVKVLIWRFGKLGEDCQIKTHQLQFRLMYACLDGAKNSDRQV